MTAPVFDRLFNKSFLRSLILVAVGALAGWLARTRYETSPAIHPAASVAGIRPGAAVHSQFAGVDSPPGPKSSAGAEVPERLRAFVALKHNGLPNINFNFFSGTKVADEFVKMFGLSEDEVARLNDSLEKANRRFEDAAISAATAKMDPDGHRFIVQVPPLLKEGGAIRDDVEQTIENVLGHGRYRVFQSLGGDQFENLFNEFGLGESTYEINIIPSVANGSIRLYDIKTTNEFPASMTNMSSNSSSGRLSADGLSKSYPILAHFLPGNVLR